MNEREKKEAAAWLLDCALADDLVGGPDDEEYRDQLLAEIMDPEWDDKLGWGLHVPSCLRTRWSALSLEMKLVAYLGAKRARDCASLYID